MIHGHTLNGTKNLTLRGWKGPRGLKGFVQGRITTAGGDKQFWDGTLAGLAVTISPDVTAGAASINVATPVTTNPCIASASGGSAPYAYAWTLIADDTLAGTWTATAPASATSAFRNSAVDEFVQTTATFRCTVTDARGATGTADVTATVLNYG